MNNHELPQDIEEQSKKERWYQRYNFILHALQEAWVPLIQRGANDPELNGEYERIYGQAAKEQANLDDLGPSIPETVDELEIQRLERETEAFIAKVHGKYPQEKTKESKDKLGQSN